MYLKQEKAVEISKPPFCPYLAFGDIFFSISKAKKPTLLKEYVKR